ncbi:MAG: PASTA domain-containing protein [Candidatus Binatia bacterium]
MSEDLVHADYAWQATWRFADVVITRASRKAKRSHVKLAADSAMTFPRTEEHILEFDPGSGNAPNRIDVCNVQLTTPERFAIEGRLTIGSKARPWTLAVGVPGVGVNQQLSQTPCGEGSGAPEDGTLFFSGQYIAVHDVTGTAGIPGANHGLVFEFAGPWATVDACRQAVARHASDAVQDAACTTHVRLPVTDDRFQYDQGQSHYAYSSEGDLSLVLRFQPARHGGTSGGGNSGGGGGSGSGACIVPALEGQPLTEAADLLVQGHCSLGTIAEETSDTVPPDVVIAQQPLPGAQLPLPGPVDLVVSQGAAQ